MNNVIYKFYYIFIGQIEKCVSPLVIQFFLSVFRCLLYLSHVCERDKYKHRLIAPSHCRSLARSDSQDVTGITNSKRIKRSTSLNKKRNSGYPSLIKHVQSNGWSSEITPRKNFQCDLRKGRARMRHCDEKNIRI